MQSRFFSYLTLKSRQYLLRAGLCTTTSHSKPPSPPSKGRHHIVAYALPRIALVLFFSVFQLCIALNFSAPAHAQTQTQAPVNTSSLAENVSESLRTERSHLNTIQSKLNNTLDNEALGQLRQQTMQIYLSVDQLVESLSSQINDWQLRLTELGEAPQDQPEDAQAAQQRQYLNAVIAQADSQNRLANLLLRDTEQTLSQITSLRRNLFQQQLLERTPSVLTGRFWSNFQNNLNLDQIRGKALIAQIHQHLQTISVWLWIGIAIWTALTWLFLHQLSIRLRAFSALKAPAGRLRQSLYAWQKIVLFTAAPFIWLGGIYFALSWFAPMPEIIRLSFTQFIGASAFCFYIMGLGSALLAANAPNWRILALRNITASALKHLPFALAFMLMIAWLSEQANQMVNARLGLSVLSDSVFCLIVAMIFATALLRIHHIRKTATSEPPSSLHQSSWVGSLLKNNHHIITFAMWCVLFAVMVALLFGYVALAKFVLQQLIWSLTVIATAFLLSVTISDIAAWLTIKPSSNAPSHSLPESGTEQDSQEQPTHALKKWIILGAGLAQASIALLTVILLFASFNAESLGLGMYLQFLQGDLKWGGIEIKPLAIVQAIVLFLIGAWLISIVKKWLTERFFPTTGLDQGIQASLSTLASYGAYVVVFSMALSVTGIGFERVTWIASALSVGIGFGLQAIVQNFVSGLILLAERPVKVGDWVSLSGIEGDIRRINVRATEIQMSDRSTVIVPNSEFVTKMVRNITYADSLGRLQIKLAMPLNSPPLQVQAIIEQALREHTAVLSEPAPAVYMDDVNSSSMIFNAVAYVRSPRLAYGTRSALLFTILERLKEANISTINPVGPTLQPTTPTP